MDQSDLHNYQVRAIDHIIENASAGLFMDMGLGKTVSTLTALDELLYKELEILRVLVVAPKRVVESVWSAEALKWSHLRHLRINKAVGPARKRFAAIMEKSDICLISRDNIGWLCDNFETLPFDMLVVDELSSFKNASSQRFKKLKKKVPDFSRVVGLTGTPAPNSLTDLWPQIYLLDQGERLGHTLTSYRRRYFYTEPYVYGYKLKKGSEDVIHEKIKDICISMEAKDYLDLPERIDNVVGVNFPEDLAAQYDEFAKEAIMSLAEADVTAMNAAVLANKLLQFTNGAIYDEDRNVHRIHDLKVEAAEEIVAAANGKPVLIAWAYQFDRDRLLKVLPGARELKDNKTVEDWNAGKIPVLLMHPASGGHGLNLQEGGNIIIWFGQTWSLELYQQLNARLHRQGQTSAVIVHHLVINNTMDEAVIKRLNSKQKGQQALIEATKATILKYTDGR